MAKNSTRTQKSSFNSKRFFFVLSRIGLVLLILIPTYLAIIGYFFVKNAPEETTQTYYTAVSIQGPSGFIANGAPAGEDEEETDSSILFNTFVLMLKEAVYTPYIPIDTHAWKYEVTMATNAEEEELYDFYFSPEDTAAYFQTADGTQYRTEDTAAKDFLNGPYAFELYVAATPPVLTTAATDEIIPSDLEWSYQTQDGTFSDLTQLVIANGLTTYPIANDVAFYFSLEPTSCHLVIRDGDTVIHDEDTLEGISLPWLTQGKELDFEIEAVWTQSSASNYYGSAVYRFRMVVVEAATFTLNTTSNTFGDCFLLTCHNLRNEQKLVVTAEPALLVDPIVFKRGELVYAVIPADQIGNRRLIATYGTVSSSFDVTVSARANETEHTLSFSQLRGDWVSALTIDLPAIIAEKGAKSALDAQFYPSGSLGLPFSGATPTLAFGDTLTVSGTALSSARLPFEYYERSGSVAALSHGRVLECGEDAVLGKYVIVDHGCGLYTWYCGLSDVHVTVGSAVAIGDTVGVAGRSGIGLSDTDGVLVLATWGQAVISPQYLR